MPLPELYYKCLCPLTQLIFKHPVKCKYLTDGEKSIIYEKEAIKKWLSENNNLCPITKKEVLKLKSSSRMKKKVKKLLNNPEYNEYNFKDEQFVAKYCTDLVPSQPVETLPQESDYNYNEYNYILSFFTKQNENRLRISDYGEYYLI